VPATQDTKGLGCQYYPMKILKANTQISHLKKQFDVIHNCIGAAIGMVLLMLIREGRKNYCHR
jgi:hypothetical protein